MSRAMKDSGMEWIGEVPADWEILRIQRIGKLTSSGIDKTVNEDEQCVRIINYTDVYGNPTGELAEKDYMEVTAPTWKVKEHQVKVGDVIFTPSSETIEDIGVAAVVIEPLPNTAFSYHVLRLSVKVDIIIKYRKHLFNNHFLQSHFSSRATGSIRKTLNRNDFKTANLLIPPLEEQVNIASFLDSAILQIFKLVNLQEQSIFELQAYKQSIITEAVTKGLDPDVPMKDSGVDWIGEIPEHWNVSMIKNELDCYDHLRKPISAELRVNELSLYDYYGASGVIDKIDDYNVEGRMLLIGEDGANLVYRNLPLIYKAEGRFWVNNHAHILKEKAHNDYDYVAYLLEAGDYTSYITGSAQPKLSQENLMRFKILRIPMNEQTEIVAYLDSKVKQIDSLINLKNQKAEALKEYKQSLVYECVTGKRDCREGSHADA